MPEQTERQTVEPRDLDDQQPAGLQRSAGVRQRPERVVIVLEEVPHRHQIEPVAANRLLVKQAVMELHALELTALCQIDEIDTGTLRPRDVANVGQECAGSTTNVEHPFAGADLDVAADDPKLGAIER